eukprot:6483051-Amphidinium_carterae.2
MHFDKWLKELLPVLYDVASRWVQAPAAHFQEVEDRYQPTVLAHKYSLYPHADLATHQQKAT